MLLARHFTPARSEIDVGRAHLPIHVSGRDAIRQQPVGIELNADFAVDAAVAFNLADALEAKQLTLDHIVDMPRQLLKRHARARCRIGQDRLAFDIDARDDRFVDCARQVGADLVDRVFDVVDRPVGVDLKPEFNGRHRRAVGDSRLHMLDASDVGNGVLDLFGHLRFKFSRRRAALRHLHGDHGHIDVREFRHRQPHEAHDAEQHEHGEQQNRRHRIADGPGGEINVHHFASLTLGSGMTGRTISPSRRNDPARATTTSPSASPLLTSTSSPEINPVLITRRSTLLALSTCT